MSRLPDLRDPLDLPEGGTSPTWMATARRRHGEIQLQGVSHSWSDRYRDNRILLIDETVPVGWMYWSGPPPVAEDLAAAFPATAVTPSPPAPRLPTTTLVICTRDRADSLRRCLTRLMSAIDEDVALIIVDSVPRTAQTAEVVDEFMAKGLSIDYVVEPRPGLSRARNRALELVTTELTAFTDDDVVLEPDWLRPLRAAFVDTPATALATGLVPPAELETSAQNYFERRVPWSSRLDPCRISLGHHPGYDLAFPFAAGQFGAGANMAIRTELVRHLGGFDTALGAGTLTRGGEDLEMFVRVLRAGYEIAFVPSSLVWHIHQRGLPALRRQVFAYGAGLAAYLTSVLLRPGRTALLRTVPAGLKFTFASRREHVKTDLDRRLLLAEVLGILWGPWAYVGECLLHGAPQRPIPPSPGSPSPTPGG
jgi:GT2 family glycosyltransferase